MWEKLFIREDLRCRPGGSHRFENFRNEEMKSWAMGSHAEHQNGGLLYKPTHHKFHVKGFNADAPQETLKKVDWRCELVAEFKTLFVGKP